MRLVRVAPLRIGPLAWESLLPRLLGEPGLQSLLWGSCQIRCTCELGAGQHAQTVFLYLALVELVHGLCDGLLVIPTPTPITQIR